MHGKKDEALKVFMQVPMDQEQCYEYLSVTNSFMPWSTKITLCYYISYKGSSYNETSYNYKSHWQGLVMGKRRNG